MVSVDKGAVYKPLLVKDSIYRHIYWGKYNFFPYALFGIGRHTPAILRLSRYAVYLKFSGEDWLNGVYGLCFILFSDSLRVFS